MLVPGVERLGSSEIAKGTLSIVAEAVVGLLHHPAMVIFIPLLTFAATRIQSLRTEHFVTHASVLTWSSVRHAQQKRLLMEHLKVLIVKLLAINALAARAIAGSEITCRKSATCTTHTRSGLSYPPWIMKPLITRWKPEPL
jgi:hypothetical protein